MDDPVLLPLTHARRFAWPVPDLWTCSSLSEADLRAYYRFRRQFMDLKPHVDPEKDWQTFASWVKGADFCWFQRSSDGFMSGVMGFLIEHRVHQGRPVMLVVTEYGYALPSARQSTGLAGAVIMALCVALLRSPGTPVYVMGIGYVASYISLAQGFDSAWFDEDPAMSPWERSLWWDFARGAAGFDPSSRLVSMGTIPRHPRTSPPSDPKVRSAWERYNKHNPNWFEGTACVVMGRLQLSFVSNAVRRLARGWLRAR